MCTFQHCGLGSINPLSPRLRLGLLSGIHTPPPPNVELTLYMTDKQSQLEQVAKSVAIQRGEHNNRIESLSQDKFL
jgi:hypothetical protein